MKPADRYVNKRFRYPVLVVRCKRTRDGGVVVFVTVKNRALWRLDEREFLARFEAEE